MKALYWLIGLIAWATKEEKMKYLLVAAFGAMLIAGVALAIFNT